MPKNFRVRATVAVLGLFLVGAAPTTPPAAKRSLALAAALSTTPTGHTHLAWVFFTDKGAGQAAAALTPRAVSRRRLRGQIAGATVEDAPLAAAYVDQVTAVVQRVRERSRWFNAMSVEATAAQLEAVEALSFVARIDLVRRYRRRAEEPVSLEPDSGA